MITVTTRIASLALAAAAAFATVPAAAAPLGHGRSIAVRHADLDLTTTSGVAQLQRRVAVAARKICNTADPRDLAARSDMLACRTVTVAAAMPKVELAVAAARSGEAQVASGTVPTVSIP